MNATALPALTGERGLTSYLREIQKFPLLSADEEFMYAKRWSEHKDTEAAHRLITSHLRLVVKIAMRYRKYRVPISDVISEGNIGLMKAVQKFDPDRGVRLSTYAMWWIKAAIHEFILKSWSVVRVGSVDAHKRLFFGLQKAKLRLQGQDDEASQQEELLAAHFGLSADEFSRLNRRMSQRDFSLNRPISVDQPDEEFIDYLADESNDPEAAAAEKDAFEYQRQVVETAFGALNEREQQIIRARWLADEPETLAALGDRFGISYERVRQLEARALEKLKTRVRDLVGQDIAAASGRSIAAL